MTASEAQSQSRSQTGASLVHHQRGSVHAHCAARLRAVLLGTALIVTGLIATVGTVGLASLARAANDPCTAGLVGRIQTDYQALRAFESGFTQVDHQTDGRRMEASGTVAYLKPGRMRWEYAPPHEQLLVTDGETVWLFDPILENVTVQALAELTQGTPLAFLLGVGNLEQDFACRATTRTPPDDGLEYVELVPRTSIPALDFIQLGARRGSGRIAALRMVDAQGNAREVRFQNLRTDVALLVESFKFEIAPGMEVIRADAR